MSSTRKKRRPPAPERASGFGSAAHIAAYRDGFFGRAIVGLRDGRDGQAVRADLLGECRLHLREVQVLRGLPSAVADVLAGAAEDAIGRAVREYDPADPDFRRGMVRKIRLETDGDGILEPAWGEEEREALLRLKAGGAEAGVDAEVAEFVALHALEDRSGLDAAIAEGLTEADYVRREARRLDEEARDRDGPGRYRATVAGPEEGGAEGPSPDGHYERPWEYEVPSLTRGAAKRAIARYHAASAWVAAEEGADAERGPSPGRVERALLELEAATGGLWWAIRSQFPGRFDGAAISVDRVTFVASGSRERPLLVTLLGGRTHSHFFTPTEPFSPGGSGRGGSTLSS
jgi:hypothetical protein